MVLQSQKLSFSASFWKFCTQILARQQPTFYFSFYAILDIRVAPKCRAQSLLLGATSLGLVEATCGQWVWEEPAGQCSGVAAILRNP